VRPRRPFMMLLVASLTVTGCGGAPPPATPPPAAAEYKYNELPAECFPGYRHLVDEFARPMIDQINLLNEGYVISNIDSHPERIVVPPYEESDVSSCSAMFLPSDIPPPGNPRRRTVKVQLQIHRNYWPSSGTIEQQLQSLYHGITSNLPPGTQVNDLALGDEGGSWFDERYPGGRALVRDGNLWVEVNTGGAEVGPDDQDRSIPAAEAEAAAVKLAAAAFASVQR
jgi:hypothetical protein